MINVDNFIIIIGILTNLILIVGFIFGKKILKSQTTTEFNDKYGIVLVCIFTFYLIALISLIIIAIIHHLYLFGMILSLFLIIPFIVGTLSTFEKANFFVNIQVFTLFISFFLIVSIIEPIQADNIRLSEKNHEVPVMSHSLKNNYILSQHEVLSRFKKSICSIVRPYNHAFKRMVKVKVN